MIDTPKDLYDGVILDHSKEPRNFGPLTNPSHYADGRNPICGDEISVFLQTKGDAFSAFAFSGQGCAISKASASLMTDAVKGKTLTETRSLFDQFLTLVTDADARVDDAVLGKLAVFAGVCDYPTRVKCASLAWHTLRAAVDDRHEVVSTE